MKEEIRQVTETAGSLQTTLAEGEAGTGERETDGTTVSPPGQGGPAGGSTPSATSSASGGGKHPSPGTAPRQSGGSSRAREAREGARKAAVFILSLDEDDASTILKSLSDEEVRTIAGEIEDLGVVEEKTVASVMQEFSELEQLHALVREGGAQKARQLMERSFSSERAQRIIHVLDAQRQNLPFVFLEEVETDALMAFLEDEHPQTLAVILAHVSPGKSAEILERIGPENRRDVLERIATLEGVNSEALARIERSLQKYLETVRYESLGEAGGIEAVAKILRATAGGGSVFLDDIRQEQPELAEEIDKRLFVFEDLVRLDDRAIQGLLKEFDSRYLALALKKASEAVKLKILNNLNRRAAEGLQEEMEMLGPVRYVDVQSAQQAIVQAILRMEQSGQLFISGRGREENRIFY